MMVLNAFMTIKNNLMFYFLRYLPKLNFKPDERMRRLLKRRKKSQTNGATKKYENVRYKFDISCSSYQFL